MKAGIITLLGNNYGGILQTYALKKVLEKEKIQVYNINYYLPKTIELKNIIKYVVYFYRNTKFKRFKKTKINLTQKVRDINSDFLNNYKCDIYIAGSDQIWNQQIPMKYRKNFYLDFVKNNEKKIAYAASTGRDYVNEDEKKIIGKFLDDFDYISMREKTGVKIYQQLTCKKIENVLDPTLLLKKDEWNEIVNNHEINSNYICVYTLGAGKELTNYIEKISERLNVKIIDISYKRNYKNEIKNINDAGPEEFLGLIKNSEYVITNSFHGMVFSIIYKKNFWVFKRGNMNSRIFDLLKILNLTDRIIDIEKMQNIEKFNFKKVIKYEEVDRILEIEREKSLNFLKKALDIKE